MSFGLYLLHFGLQLVAGIPVAQESEHSHAASTSSTSSEHSYATTTSAGEHAHETTTGAAATVTGVTPSGCKVLVADAGFPAEAAWSSALPGVEANNKSEEETNPDYTFAVKTVSVLQAVINFIRTIFASRSSTLDTTS